MSTHARRAICTFVHNPIVDPGQAALRIAKRFGQGEPMPFRREGPDDLIEHRNGELCEFAAARTVAPQNFAGQREGMHAFERGFIGARYSI